MSKTIFFILFIVSNQFLNNKLLSNCIYQPVLDSLKIYNQEDLDNKAFLTIDNSCFDSITEFKNCILYNCYMIFIIDSTSKVTFFDVEFSESSIECKDEVNLNKAKCFWKNKLTKSNIIYKNITVGYKNGKPVNSYLILPIKISWSR